MCLALLCAQHTRAPLCRSYDTSMVSNYNNMDNDGNNPTKWLYAQTVFDQCHAKANRLAREALAHPGNDASTKTPPPVQTLAISPNSLNEMETESDNDAGPWQTPKGHPLLNAEEEALLVDFYASKLPGLIGPMAQVPRLRRDIKVAATAAILYKRFYLSNSVMMFDPKATMVSAAFLGAKVEDATADVRYLEEGTKLMDAPVSSSEIISNELSLLTGIDFDLQCVHPYKAVLAYTEDLRTFLKTAKGRALASFSGTVDRQVGGQDLKPIHDEARKIVDNCIVSNIPHLYTPGQVGLAALMAANEKLLSQNSTEVPKIDFVGYLKHRFEASPKECELLVQNLLLLKQMLSELEQGKHGCGNHAVDMVKLKAINKKLKKCRVWGKKEKKRKKEETATEEPAAKRVKTEA